MDGGSSIDTFLQKNSLNIKLEGNTSPKILAKNESMLTTQNNIQLREERNNNDLSRRRQTAIDELEETQQMLVRHQENTSQFSSKSVRLTMIDVRGKSSNSRSRSDLRVAPPKSVSVLKVNQPTKRSKSRTGMNASAICSVGLGRTLRRNQSGSKRSLSRSTSTIKRCDSTLKNVKSATMIRPPASTKMIMWGCNMSNQLGIKSQRPYITMPKKCTWNINISQISCGLDHCALVTMEGHVYTFGSNQNGKLGLGQSGLQKPKVPTLVDALSSVQIKAVSCGQEHTVAVSEQGNVYSWGLNTQGALGLGSQVTATDTPVLLPRPTNIVSISCGSHQTFMLSEDGSVRACGNNHVGQLGIKKSNSSNLFFKPSQVALDLQVMKVAAGDTHTLFQTLGGQVYAVGSNANLQLAKKREQVSYIHQPIQIEGLPDGINSIACSTYSTAISHQGDIFIWGSGAIGEYSAPYRVSGMPGRAQSCQVAKSHICVIDSDGMAWVWGENQKGELGLGDYTMRTAPFPLVGLQEKGINCLVVGHQFSIGFSKPKSSQEDVRQSDIPQIATDVSQEQIVSTSIGVKVYKNHQKNHQSMTVDSIDGRDTVQNTLSRHSSYKRIDVYGFNEDLSQKHRKSQKKKMLAISRDASKNSRSKSKSKSRKTSRKRSQSPQKPLRDLSNEPMHPMQTVPSSQQPSIEPLQELQSAPSAEVLASFRCVEDNLDNGLTPASQENLLGKQVEDLLNQEEAKLRNTAYEQDIKKLMKAVVAQRTTIEAFEKDKIEQNKTIAALQSDRAENEKLKKDFEQLKKQRTDLLDKTDEHKEQVEENKKLQHEINHLTQYFKDAQKQISQHLKTIEEYKVKDAEQHEFIERLNAQIESQNQQIVQRDMFSQENGIKELTAQLDQVKLQLEQARLKNEADDQKISSLSNQLLQKGTECNQDDIVIGQFQRQISILQKELDQERNINHENKFEMDKMIKDINIISEMGTNREVALQKKLDEQFALRRTDKLELQKAQMEVKRVQNQMAEQKVMIRHEQNNTKIMEMENEAMLRHTAQERDNLYKMQQIKALNIVPAANSALSYAPKDLQRKSKSLSKQLNQTHKQLMHKLERPQSQLVDDSDSENENNLSFTARDPQKTRRTIQASPTYNDVLKSQIKRKISQNHRYRGDVTQRSPSNRQPFHRTTAFDQAENFLKTSETGQNKQISKIPAIRQNSQSNKTAEPPISSFTMAGQQSFTTNATQQRPQQQPQQAQFIVNTMRGPNVAPYPTDSLRQLQSPPTIHDAKLATFTESNGDLQQVHENDYHQTSGTIQQNTISRPMSNQCMSYVDTTLNTGHLFSQQQTQQTTSLTQQQQQNGRFIYNGSASSLTGSTSPKTQQRSNNFQVLKNLNDMPETAQDYQTEQIRARFYQTNTQVSQLAMSMPSNLGGEADRSRSPTNNIGAHIEHIAGNEVDVASSEYCYKNSRQRNDNQTTDQAARAKRVIFDAIQRDGEISSDGRRSVHNIMNQTTSQPQINATNFTKETNQTEQRSYTNLSELSNTYKQFSGALLRPEDQSNKGIGRSASKASLSQLKKQCIATNANITSFAK